MDFKDQCKQLAERVKNLKEQAATEEATKNAFIMPFIQMLGYDVFNPVEVVPEMDCDLVKKKGEKIDYAILKNGEPIMIIECKHWEQDLDLHSTQLQKYFVATKAKFGILTNGIVYRFFTDLVRQNLMDEAPFLEIDFENLKEAQIEELKKFHKSYFDVNMILSTASELKYMSELKSQIKSEFVSPSNELVKMLTRRVYTGTITQKVLDQFSDLVKRAFANHINDVMSERLTAAMKTTEANAPNPESNVTTQSEDKLPEGVVYINKEKGIITTQEEIDAYLIVKAILCKVVAPERVYYRDTQNYFNILIDDNKLKSVCRLYLNAKTVKYIDWTNDDKTISHNKIDTIKDIYKFEDKLRQITQRYLQ